MKKLFLIPIAALALTFAACGSASTTEEVGVGTNKGIEAIEALADTTAMKANPDAANDSTLACTCEHKCKTKEECVKNCGPECGMLK